MISRSLRHNDRGQVLSTWLAVSFPFLIIALGIGIDFAGHAAAQQDARHVASQAARAAGQHSLLDGHGKVIQVIPSPASRAAQKVLSASPYTGTVMVGRTTVTVEITNATYRTRFLSFIGINTLPVRAHGTAEGVPALNGTQR